MFYLCLVEIYKVRPPNKKKFDEELDKLMSQIREKEGELEKCVSLNDNHFIFNLMFTHSLLIENPVTRSRQSMVRYRKCSKSRNERTSSCRNPKQYHTSPSPNIFCKKGGTFRHLRCVGHMVLVSLFMPSPNIFWYPLFIWEP